MGSITPASSTRSRRRSPSASITITDLQTRVVGDESAPIYALMMEVALPEGMAAEVEAALSAAGGEQGVEVTVRPLESDTL